MRINADKWKKKKKVLSERLPSEWKKNGACRLRSVPSDDKDILNMREYIVFWNVDMMQCSFAICCWNTTTYRTSCPHFQEHDCKITELTDHRFLVWLVCEFFSLQWKCFQLLLVLWWKMHRCIVLQKAPKSILLAELQESITGSHRGSHRVHMRLFQNGSISRSSVTNEFSSCQNIFDQNLFVMLRLSK